jgi:hypothetical protein
MVHTYKREAAELHEKKLKSYGKDDKEGGSKNTPKTWTGLPALSTDKQAGRAPLNSEEYIPPERKIVKKKGGAVHGAASLKRLDKASRKGKASGGMRTGPVPSGSEQQEQADPTARFKPGAMAPRTMRKKGGLTQQQDYEARSHESTAAQKRAAGGRMKDDDDHEEDHEDEREDRALVKKMVKSDALTGKSYGGRAKRAEGGSLMGDGGGKKAASTKGKTTVNILIGGAKAVDDGMGMMPPPGMMMPPPGAMPPPPPPAQMAPPPPAQMAPPPPPPQGGMPPGGMPMPRKDGGRTFADIKVSKPKIKDGYPVLTGGSGGGKGRREKVLAYGEE